jgi:hypothetical protein
MAERRMELIPVKVESHSGYKADEYPKCFYRDDVRYDIVEITDRWYQGERDHPEWPVADYFKVDTSSGGPFILKHETTDDQWYLCR